jgi:hypothetical protein
LRNYLLVCLLVASGVANATTIYLDETEYLSALAAMGYAVITAGFEDDVVWDDSRTSIPNPGSTRYIISQNLKWISNQSANRVATGTLAGSVIDGTYGFFSLPHGDDTDSGLFCDNAEDPLPSECWLNDGWVVAAPESQTIFGIGGWFYSNTGGGAKITFLLDGVDVNDGDVDGIDLEALIARESGISLDGFTAHYGKIDIRYKR